MNLNLELILMLTTFLAFSLNEQRVPGTKRGLQLAKVCLGANSYVKAGGHG